MLFLGQWRTNQIVPVSMGIYINVIANSYGNTKNVALTFDDTPNPENARKLLKILKKYDVQGAFFVNGATINSENIDAIRYTSQEGHLILSHSFDHVNLKELNTNDVDTQLVSNAERIEEVTGHYPKLFRPPYGLSNRNVVDSVNEHGMTMILWSIDSLDWTLKDANTIVQVVIGNVHNGDIILMHCNQMTIDTLPIIIEKLRQRGYMIVRLDELLGIKAYR